GRRGRQRATSCHCPAAKAPAPSGRTTRRTSPRRRSGQPPGRSARSRTCSGRTSRRRAR
ncbi:unnamed protein product, partial [Prorocentrum cordatum]